MPASADERRFFLLDVSDCKKGDLDYFNRLAAAIEGSELQHFLDFLLNHDLARWQHRAAPHTIGLNEQKLIRADSVTRFWMDCLSVGTIVASGMEETWPEDVPVLVLHAAYLDHAHAHGERHPATIEWFSRRLAALMPNGELKRIRPRKPHGDEPRPSRYALASLVDQRAAALQALNIEAGAYAWKDDEP